MESALANPVAERVFLTAAYVCSQVMEKKTNGPFTIIPIMVGAISTEKEALYGKALAKYLAQEDVCFVVSSDFCHWGSRFRYQHYDKTRGEIWESIKKLDHDGMELIEDLSPSNFASYLKSTGNTICGRHPIGVLLNSVATLQQSAFRFNCKFLRYAQSSRVTSRQDSSVSYASAAFLVDDSAGSFESSKTKQK